MGIFFFHIKFKKQTQMISYINCIILFLSIGKINTINLGFHSALKFSNIKYANENIGDVPPEIPEMELPDTNFTIPDINFEETDLEQMEKELKDSKDGLIMMKILLENGGYEQVKILNMTEEQMIEFTDKMLNYIDKFSAILDGMKDGTMSKEKASKKANDMLNEMRRYLLGIFLQTPNEPEKPIVPIKPNNTDKHKPDMPNIPNFNNTKPDFGDKSNDMTKLLEKNREMVIIMNGLRFGGGYGKYKISDFSQKKMLEFTNKLMEYAEKTQDLLEQWHNGVLTDEQLNEKSDKLLKEMTKYINNFLGRAVSVSPISWLWLILIAVL